MRYPPSNSQAVVIPQETQHITTLGDVFPTLFLPKARRILAAPFQNQDPSMKEKPTRENIGSHPRPACPRSCIAGSNHPLFIFSGLLPIPDVFFHPTPPPFAQEPVPSPSCLSPSQDGDQMEGIKQIILKCRVKEQVWDPSPVQRCRCCV